MNLHGSANQRAHNGELARNQKRPSLEEVIGGNITVTPGGCWIWKNQPDRYADHASVGKVYRWTWELFNGKLPSSVHIHHLCEIKGCVNPGHLVAVTASQHSAQHQRLRKFEKYIAELEAE